MMSVGEIVNVERRGQQNGHHIAHRHPQQHSVGGCPHLGSGEHGHDDGVEECGDDHEGGHDVAIDWKHQVQRPQPFRGVHLVALIVSKTSKM